MIAGLCTDWGGGPRPAGGLDLLVGHGRSSGPSCARWPAAANLASRQSWRKGRKDGRHDLRSAGQERSRPERPLLTRKDVPWNEVLIGSSPRTRASLSCQTREI